MRALRYHNPGDLRLEDIPEPVCLLNQVKVRPAFVGICGTDLHEYSSSTFIPEPSQPHPVTGEARPLTIGHEISGVVVEVGAKATNKSLKIGSRVVIRPTVCCFACSACKEGYLSCCATPGFLGLSGGGGGMSEFICVDSEFVHVLPEGIPLDIGALVEPLGTCWRAVAESKIDVGADVLILGGGPIGLGVVACCKAKGARSIIVSEVAAERRALATLFGATQVVNPLTEDVVAVTKAASSDGGGATASFDCAGLQQTIEVACRAVRPRGIVVNVAIWEKPVSFDLNLLCFGERRLHAVLGYSKEDFDNVIAAVQDGSLQLQRMITRKISIDRVVEDGFNTLVKDKNTQVKIQVDMQTV